MLWPLLFLPLLSLARTTHKEFIAQAKANKGVIVLDNKSFEDITSPDRTWSATIQLTALESNYKCAPCKAFDPAFNAVAKAWTKAPAESRDQHFFATLEFGKGADIFRKLALNSAPVVYTYPAAKGDRRPANGKVGPIAYDFSNGFEAELLVDGLSRHVPSPIPYKPPTNWAPFFGTAFAFFITAAGARIFLPLFVNRWFWASISLVTSLIMISGFMFVRIRGSPNMVISRDGRAEWIAGGFQNQYGMEVNLVAVIYGFLSLGFLVLILIAPRITSAWKQKFMIYFWCGIITIVYSALLSFFRAKNPSYPYRLFF